MEGFIESYTCSNGDKFYEHHKLPYTLWKQSKYNSYCAIIIAPVQQIIEIYNKVNNFSEYTLYKSRINYYDTDIDSLPEYLEVTLGGGTVIEVIKPMKMTKLFQSMLDCIPNTGMNPFAYNKKALKSISPAMSTITKIAAATINGERILNRFIPTNSEKVAMKILQKEPEILAALQILCPKWYMLSKMDDISDDTCYVDFLTQSL